MTKLRDRAQSIIAQLDTLTTKDIRKSLDAQVTVFHMSKDIIEQNIGVSQDVASGILGAYWEIYKSKRISLERLETLIATDSLKSVVSFRAGNSRDFVLVSPNKSMLSSSLKLTTNTIALKPGLEFLVGKDEKRAFDIARVTTLDSRSPGEIFLSRVAQVFTGSSSSVSFSKLAELKRRLKKEHKSVYKASLSVSLTTEALKGKFTFEYTVPLNKKLNRALIASENKVLDDLVKEVDTIRSGRTINELLDNIIDAAFLGTTAKRTIKGTISDSAKLKSSRKDLRLNQQKKLPFKTKRGKGVEEQELSLITLQSLINAVLTDTLQENMNTPALNYRTGRFANSVKVESITKGRAGMLSIFYSYMKNPYQTFEPGYAQGSPARDPRLLISKSIRQIAIQLVERRFRSIRV